MVFPLVAFAIGAVLLSFMLQIGWTSGSLTEDESALLRYMLAGLAVSVLSIIVWGIRSQSNRHRKRWTALILASVLFILLGAWWIISIGLFIALIGLVLLLYSSIRLAATLR